MKPGGIAARLATCINYAWPKNSEASLNCVVLTRRIQRLAGRSTCCSPRLRLAVTGEKGRRVQHFIYIRNHDGTSCVKSQGNKNDSGTLHSECKERDVFLFRSEVADGAQRAMVKRLLPVGILLLLCACGVGCKSADPKPATVRTGTGPTVPVAVATAQSQDMPVYLTGLGSVTAFNTVGVKSRVDGQLMQVTVKEGQRVNRGELL